MSAAETKSYRLGLSRVLEVFQLSVRNSTILKARLLLMMPTETTAAELAFQLHTNHVTITTALQALRQAGLIHRTRRGCRIGPSRHEATAAGEAIFALPHRNALEAPISTGRPQRPAQSVPTRKTDPAEHAEAMSADHRRTISSI